MKKLLFYSHDSYGLGNIRRMVAIANFLVSRHRELYILLITGSPMLHAFRTQSNIDYIKLPCLQRSKSGTYSAKLDCLSASALLDSRAKIIQQVITDYEPDLVLVDKKPGGLNGELKPSLSFLSSLIKPPKLVLLLRDILDTPEVTQQLWRKNSYYQLVEKYYEQVLVVGEQRIFDMVQQYDFPPSVEKMTEFCGYLQRTEKSHQSSKLLAHLAKSDRKLVVAAAGGGDDGKLVLETYLLACHQSSWKDQVDSIVFYGPEMNVADIKNLQSLAQSLPNTTLSEFSPYFMTYLSAADLVVTMAGYNTVCEILSVKTPAILVPRVTPVAEQLIRAQQLAKLEIFEYLHPEHITPKELNKKIENKLFSEEAQLPFPQEISLHGMEKLERHLLA
ncbi:glycosyltransferase family protein [Vibrio ouci]|uniref:Glycosyltransferase n=1 Tax=Vibrio ouci TaxID=2499078 RepID=A0A4Y8WFA0_9VIBR|nr:glycosyltransferase [Vibrio ouci]TFH91610.1 glycosyltransferase [Vibrio ouci]